MSSQDGIDAARALAAIGCALALAGCGGGEAGSMPAPRESPTAATTAPPPPTPTQLFEWAEFTYPDLFPRGPVNETLTSGGVGYVLRHYPSTGNYAGVGLADNIVYALGAFTGNVITSYGPIESYTCLVLPLSCAGSQVLDVTVVGSGSGTVSGYGASCRDGTCSSTQPAGSVVTLVATPDAGSVFAGWSGDDDCADGVVTMSTARRCSARFHVPRTLTVTVGADGSFTPSTLALYGGDTVEWQFPARGEAVVPVRWDGASRASCVPLPYTPTDPNHLTGPLPRAVSGLFSLSPLEVSLTVEPAAARCRSGALPSTTAGTQMLCPVAQSTVSLDALVQSPGVTGVFIRMLWKDVHIAPGTGDASYDFRAMDREIDKVVRAGKVYSLGFKAGQDGTPDWLFTNGVTRLALQDSGEDTDATCGARMTLGDPTEARYQQHYADLLRKVAAHLRERADRYRALAYIKPSGANLISHENRLPKRCDPGCVCNTRLFAQRGYRPSGLYAFYRAQTDLLAAEFPDKSMGYALIQAGFPRINEAGDHENEAGVSSGAALPAGTEQTETILNEGRLRHGQRFVVAHNGLQTKPAADCQARPATPGCPNRWALEQAQLGQVIGWQTNNASGVANPRELDSALRNAWDNSPGIYVEAYEDRLWEADRQGVLDPAGSGRTLAQWAEQFHARRRTLHAGLGDPLPLVHRHTFQRTAGMVGEQRYAYARPAACGSGPVGTVVLQP